MSTELNRQAVSERFLSDPDFRTRFQADPAGTVESELGTLTIPERRWLASLDNASGEDLLIRLKGASEAW